MGGKKNVKNSHASHGKTKPGGLPLTGRTEPGGAGGPSPNRGSQSRLADRDLDCLWHPCSQMKDYDTFPPVVIQRARGSYLYRPDGFPIIDAISSWWCKTLGHGHSEIRATLTRQSGTMEHVIFAGTAQEPLVALGEVLTGLTQNLKKVFFASEGSTAVEIALKMALHAQKIKGNPKKTRFIALENGYHGESAGALGVSDLGLYKDPYRAMCPEADFLRGLPYVSHLKEDLALDCGPVWPSLESQLDPLAETAAALILEPVLQGAGQMKVYSPDLLRRLRRWCREHEVYLIADEILTGFGRTGKQLAVEHGGIEPDILCLSKGLTAGWLPMSAVLTTRETYDLFFGDYEAGNSFLHSNTYSGNALAAAVALKALEIYRRDRIVEGVCSMESFLVEAFREVGEATGKFKNLRHCGGVVAADLVVPQGREGERWGYRVFQSAVERGAWLRPLGNTLYWLLPLNVEKDTIEALKKITMEAVRDVLV